MTTTGKMRLLGWDGCLNARDIGGYRTRDGRETRWGAVVRSDHPGRLSDIGRQSLVAYGVRTIVDLRLPEELVEFPHPFAEATGHDIIYAHRPFIRPGVPPPSNLDELSMLENYIDMVDKFQDSVTAIMRTIAAAPAGGVLVHCAIGKDRTGITCGMLLDIAGVDRETIGIDYSLSESCLEPERMDWLENGPGEREERIRFIEKHNPHPEVMMSVLEHVDRRFGGVADYLQQSGMPDAELLTLQNRLVVDPATL